METILTNAEQFVAFSILFPFLLVFAIAGIACIIVVGFVLLVPGLKSGWIELNKVGRVFKIIRIVVGAILLTIALLAVAFIVTGFVEIIARGGIFASDKPNQAIVLLTALKSIFGY